MALRSVFLGRQSLLLRSTLTSTPSSSVGTLVPPHNNQPLSCLHRQGFTSLLQPQPSSRSQSLSSPSLLSLFHTSSPHLAAAEIEEAEIEEIDYVEVESQQSVNVQQYGVTPQTFVHKKEHRMTFDELYSNLKDFLTNEDYLYFKVKKVAVYHLFDKAQSKEDFQKAREILKETQVRMIEYPDATIKVMINSALRTGALDEGVGLFHRSRTMAQYFNGDSFIYRLFPPPTQFNYFMNELIKRGRDDLIPILIKTFRARFFPHRDDKDVSASNRRDFYLIVLKWLRTLGENEEANHIVEEIESAAGLNIGERSSLVELVCGHYLTGGFQDPSVAAQKAREWGHPVIGDCCEILALALAGEEESASQLYQKTVTSTEAGKIFFRLVVQNSGDVGKPVGLLAGKWSNEVNNTNQHAKTCAERCSVFLEGGNEGEGKEEAPEEANTEEDAGGDE